MRLNSAFADFVEFFNHFVNVYTMMNGGLFYRFAVSGKTADATHVVRGKNAGRVAICLQNFPKVKSAVIRRAASVLMFPADAAKRVKAQALKV